MSHRLTLIGILAICFVFNSFRGHAAVMPAVDTGDRQASVFDLSPESLVSKSKSELQAEIGRKLTLKEKIALKFVKRKLKKNKDLSPRGALEQAEIDGLAIAGFVTGLVGIFILGIILGTLGIVFSAIALSRIKKEPEVRTGKGLAIAGLVLGIISVLGALIIIAAA
ncbi:DUF4190 domain-containing protein [Phaeodactylibacter xiamenensis]|jgi:hypothetical protein|uniref:DUF4190 domain-containing protein n=1 Tax=Phaeodactylibacter xiamenensis TaxID=1524460 RepID=UPI0024A911C9|nr:DUF4190 domain-containing protein [Phaeodactylibacter xiamenensis]